MINASAFVRACKLPGAQTFRIHLSDTSVSTKTASISEKTPDLSLIPEEYHDFADVFSETKANKLAPHRPYDLKIELDEGAMPPVGAMYALSQVELQTLLNSQMSISPTDSSAPPSLRTELRSFL